MTDIHSVRVARDPQPDCHTESFASLLADVEGYTRAGEPFGCGNLHCSKGCNMEYENVPNPHVYRSFYLAFEHDDEKGWHWEVEGCGLIATGDDPVALLKQAAAFPVRKVPGS